MVILINSPETNSHRLAFLNCGAVSSSVLLANTIRNELEWTLSTTALNAREREPLFISHHDSGTRGARASPPHTLSERSNAIKINQAPRRKIASTVISLLFSCAILFGTCNFNENHLQFSQSAASAMETEAQAMATATKDDSNSQSSTAWPPTSDKDLFKQTFSQSYKSSNPKQRYWDTMQYGTAEEIRIANEKLVDNAIVTINTMYYDSSGGFAFDPKTFYAQWKNVKYLARNSHETNKGTMNYNRLEYPVDVEEAFSTRENTVRTLKWLVSTVGDPYSKYLTREELTQELVGGDDGFLGLGALVDAPTTMENELEKNSIFPRSSDRSPDWNSKLAFDKVSNRNKNGQWEGPSIQQFLDTALVAKREMSAGQVKGKNRDFLSVSQALNLPVIKAIVPDSPAEHAGLEVGDRIASVGSYQFTGMSLPQVRKALETKSHAENYFGQADLVLAKPIALHSWDIEDDAQQKYVFEDGWYLPRRSLPKEYQNRRTEQVLGYKLSHVKSIPTTLTAGAFKLDSSQLPVSQAGSIQSPMRDNSMTYPAVVGGDSIVHYATLTSNDSIFQKTGARPVGYIRLTRFSKASTAGYINAINSLEAAGVDSYIIDLRNNYGGVIQEAMLTASTLLRDPYSVLCYTLNGRGGFRPQENMEYIIDKNYPGYFLSSEPKNIALEQVKREHPEYLDDGWSSPTSYASLLELKRTRGIKSAHAFVYVSGQVGKIELKTSIPTDKSSSGIISQIELEKLTDIIDRASQKKIAILINEGTASAAEVFASALHDNGRTVALIGNDSYGKGLIQHTFPLPDGGGLRLTVAEYLTPTLSHVTKVGGAKINSGIHPDVRCESDIPKNVGSDICVGVALDVLGN